MPVAPPAVIVMAVPSAPFNLERLDQRPLTANISFAANCHTSDDGTIVICSKLSVVAPNHRVAAILPPPPLDEVPEPLMVKRGRLEFGAGRKGIGLRLAF